MINYLCDDCIYLKTITEKFYETATPIVTKACNNIIVNKLFKNINIGYITQCDYFEKN